MYSHNSTENLRFDKAGYFYVLIFYELFYKRNRKHFFPFPYVIETRLLANESLHFQNVFL